MSRQSVIPVFLLCLTVSLIKANKLMEDQAANHTFLEDFQLDNNDAPAGDANAEQLEIAFTIPDSTNGLSAEEFYKKAVENLKKKYEKLNKLRLRGGYVFKPKNSKSSDALKAEIEHLIQTVKIIDKAVNEQNIRLRRLVLSAVLVFDKSEDLNITELFKNGLTLDGEIHDFQENWDVPFKIEHGRGLIKVSLSTEQLFAERNEGRTRYYPVNKFHHRMGPGPMIGSASYNPETNKTSIFSAKKGQVELDGNHMDSEELEEYFPRGFDNE